MHEYLLIVSSPDGEIFRGEVAALFVRGVEGDLAVLAGHTPFVTTVKPCECRIVKADGEEISGKTDGGILTVSSDKVIFLSGSFEL